MGGARTSLCKVTRVPGSACGSLRRFQQGWQRLSFQAPPPFSLEERQPHGWGRQSRGWPEHLVGKRRYLFREQGHVCGKAGLPPRKEGACRNVCPNGPGTGGLVHHSASVYA